MPISSDGQGKILQISHFTELKVSWLIQLMDKTLLSVPRNVQLLGLGVTYTYPQLPPPPHTHTYIYSFTVFHDIDIATPVILMVVGGDQFTLSKVAWAVQNNIVVVILSGSGAIANSLSSLVIEMEELRKRYNIP